METEHWVPSYKSTICWGREGASFLSETMIGQDTARNRSSGSEIIILPPPLFCQLRQGASDAFIKIVTVIRMKT